MPTASASVTSVVRRAVPPMLVGCVGVALGYLAGATYGGNYAEDAYFAGVRGYEATGLLGAIAGGAIGAVTVILLRRRVSGG